MDQKSSNITKPNLEKEVKDIKIHFRDILIEDRFYFMKITNEKNGCFANCIIQALLSLGSLFHEVSKNLIIKFIKKQLFA